MRCISVSALVSTSKKDAFCDMAFPSDVVSAWLRDASFTAFSCVYDNF